MRLFIVICLIGMYLTPSVAGTARVCLTEETDAIVDVPAGAVFVAKGKFKGQLNDPLSWDTDDFKGSGSIVTLSSIRLSKKDQCKSVTVNMLTSNEGETSSAKVKDNQYYQIDDFINYLPPANRPAIELGKLIDDIGLKAILETDVAGVTKSPNHFALGADKPVICHDGAEAFASRIGASLGRQTPMVVFLEGIQANESSYGCPFGPHNVPDFFIAFDGPFPPTGLLNTIGKGGAILTGASEKEIRDETTLCLKAALQPDSYELSNREIRGVRIECQSFIRDGGGGSVNIYRRF